MKVLRTPDERFARVIASNSGIPLGEVESEFMKMWVGMMRDPKEFPMEQMLPSGMTHAMRPGELAAYRALSGSLSNPPLAERVRGVPTLGYGLVPERSSAGKGTKKRPSRS